MEVERRPIVLSNNQLHTQYKFTEKLNRTYITITWRAVCFPFTETK